MLAPQTMAQDTARFALIEENDGIITREDKHYTQGAVFTYLSSELPAGGLWDRSFDAIAAIVPVFRSEFASQRRLEWQILGQSMFVPDDLDRAPPDPRDRPYAAWLYTGLGWLQENEGRSLHNLEVQAGVVGPAALGEETGNSFHSVFNFNRANGWDYQLGNRAAIQLSYGYRRRIALGRADGFGVDVVPVVGLSAGSILRYAEAGAILRVGNARNADYGPERIRPALSGTAFADPRRLESQLLSYYVFIGAQTRRWYYNHFIEASREVASPGVEAELWGTDLLAGMSCWITSAVRIDFTATRRSREFVGQTKADVYAGASFSFAL